MAMLERDFIPVVAFGSSDSDTRRMVFHEREDDAD
jgi:hypothetical protein